MATCRAAIIGLSWIATDPPPPASGQPLGTGTPFSHAAALAAIPGVEVVAGCDISAVQRTEFLDRWRGRWPAVKTYENYRDLLATERPDLVTIATPDFLHRDPFIAAVDAGAKGIFAEKPLATSLIDATAMVEAARAAGVVTNVDFFRRWMPFHVAVRAFIREGRLGRLSQVIVELGGERAMLWRNHPHAIDMLAYFADSDPAWVSGELEPGYETYGTEYRGDGGRTTDLEPAANYYVAFRNGVRGYVTGMKDTMPGIMITLRGTGGRITLNDQGAEVTVIEQIGHGAQSDWTNPRTERVVPAWTVSGMEAAIRDLITGIETGRPTAGPVEHAWRSAAIVDAVLRSQAGGNGPVTIDPPAWARPA
jgi:predicted dehydrogenase